MKVVSNNSFPEIVKNSFQSIEEYSDSLVGLDLHGYQLSKGDFNGHSKIIISHNFQLAIRQADAQHFQRARIDAGKIGMIFPLVQNEYINNGRNLSPEKQYVIFNGEENKIIFPKHHKHISLIINTEELNNYLSEDETHIFINIFRNLSTRVVCSEKKLLLTRQLHDIFEVFKLLAKNTTNNHLVYQDLYDSLFYSIHNYQHAYSDEIIEKRKNNERLLSRALDYIHSESLQSLTVSSLVTNTHASSRTIQYCFSRLLGISPKKYIIRLRLNAIRKELKNSSQNETTITEIANNYGVINLGRFKQDYEKFFNESPRQTLERN